GRRRADGTEQPLGQRRGTGEVGGDEVTRQHRSPDVAETRRQAPHLAACPAQFDQALQERVDGRRDGAGDVPDHVFPYFERQGHGPDDVIDEDEVAELVAVTVKVNGRAGGEALEEDRDHAAVDVGALPGPVDVRRAQDGVWYPFGPHHLLGGELVETVVAAGRREC